jgi:hypothetical protein
MVAKIRKKPIILSEGNSNSMLMTPAINALKISPAKKGNSFLL